MTTDRRLEWTDVTVPTELGEVVDEILGHSHVIPLHGAIRHHVGSAGVKRNNVFRFVATKVPSSR